MSKNFRLFFVFLLLMIYICFGSQLCFSEEKKIGFVKSSWRKFLNFLKKTRKTEVIKPAQPEKTDVTIEPEVEKEKRSLIDLDKQGLIEKIKYMLDINMEIPDFIPELRVKRDKANEIIKIEYKIGGIFKNIENLDKEILIKVYNRINNEHIKLQNDRMIKQFESIRQAQEAARVSMMQQAIHAPVSQPPTTPPQVNQPPKTAPTHIPQPSPNPPQVSTRR